MDYSGSGANTIAIYAVIFDLLFTLPILLGNLLIILVFSLYLQREHRHADFFIVNLAMSDFLVGLMLPFDASFYIDDNLGYSKVACFVRSAIIMVALGQSITSLMAISLDRFMAVCYPMKYSKLVTRRRVKFVVVFSWVVVVAISAMPILGEYE